VTVDDLDAIATARRLEQMGITVKSPTLAAAAREVRDFHDAGGNRAMRRQAARQARRARR
jgi:hypothetical protein